MGTQQILMIILSVIVVGAAVAVGIGMFDTQSVNQERNAIHSELMQMAVQAQAWYRTPLMMGGGGKKAALVPEDAAIILKYINSRTYDGIARLDTDMGMFEIEVAPGPSPTTIWIRCLSAVYGDSLWPLVWVDLAHGHRRILLKPQWGAPDSWLSSWD
jgi:hypothetical protein